MPAPDNYNHIMLWSGSLDSNIMKKNSQYFSAETPGTQILYVTVGPSLSSGSAACLPFVLQDFRKLWVALGQCLRYGCSVAMSSEAAHFSQLFQGTHLQIRRLVHVTLCNSTREHFFK